MAHHRGTIHENQHVFDDLKLRVGYGVSGNSLGFDAFIARPLYGATGWFTYVNPDGSTSNYRMLGATRNANPDLKWEVKSTFNAGWTWDLREPLVAVGELLSLQNKGYAVYV